MNALSTEVSAHLRDARIPGCSIAVVAKSGALWCGSHGVAEVRKSIHADNATVYPLFSGTKLFTAVSVLQLAEKGLLTLNDSVSRFLPEVEHARDVTLLHLLSHQSGLSDTLRGFLAVSFPPDKPPTSVEALKRYEIRAKRRPGERVEYRNVNYALLGAVISRAAGYEYREYVQRYVLDPLNMKASFALPEANGEHAAAGYLQRWDPMRVVLRLMMPKSTSQMYRGRIGGLLELNRYELDTASIGGLIGSMPDFCKFLHSQLNGGRGVLASDVTARMQALVARGAAGIESRHGVGLGWKIGVANGRRFLNHEGGGAGFTTELRLYPDAGLGIAIGMNLMRMPHTMRAAHRICEAVYARRNELVSNQTAARHRVLTSSCHSSSFGAIP